MKKYFAFLLVAIMATSVLSAAGVVTTQKAAAQPAGYLAVNYKPGATYRFWPWQYNMHFTIFRPTANPRQTPTWPQNSESASGGVAHSSISTTQTEQGVSVAEVGMFCWLNVPTATDWNTVKNMPCTVTMTVLSYVSAKGTQDTIAEGQWGTFAWVPPQTISVNGAGNTEHHLFGLSTKTFTTTVGNVFVDTSNGPEASLLAIATASQNTPGAGSAAATVICSSIVLSFPQASHPT